MSAPTASNGERRKVRATSKLLIIALMVGFCVTGTPEAVPLETASGIQKQIQVIKAPPQPKQYAYMKTMAQWHERNEYKCLVQLWERESHWNPQAHNKSSGAFGIAQFLPQTWANYNYPDKPKEATIQITAGLRYITKRYGSPCRAWRFWQRQAAKGNAWY